MDDFVDLLLDLWVGQDISRALHQPGNVSLVACSSAALSQNVTEVATPLSRSDSGFRQDNFCIPS